MSISPMGWEGGLGSAGTGGQRCHPSLWAGKGAWPWQSQAGHGLLFPVLQDDSGDSEIDLDEDEEEEEEDLEDDSMEISPGKSSLRARKPEPLEQSDNDF